uniref:immunoglobulin-like domain-containing receptor 1 isoform X2 n=1 Tax=Myxine glutinosa TaxID=7769 RepID=UPI00358F2650
MKMMESSVLCVVTLICWTVVNGATVTVPYKERQVMLFGTVLLRCDISTSSPISDLTVSWIYKSYCQDPLLSSHLASYYSLQNLGVDPANDCDDSKREVRTVVTKQGIGQPVLGNQYRQRKITLQNDWQTVLCIVLGGVLLFVLLGICCCQCCPHCCCCYVSCPCCPERCCCPRELYTASKYAKSQGEWYNNTLPLNSIPPVGSYPLPRSYPPSITPLIRLDSITASESVNGQRIAAADPSMLRLLQHTEQELANFNPRAPLRQPAAAGSDTSFGYNNYRASRTRQNRRPRSRSPQTRPGSSSHRSHSSRQGRRLGSWDDPRDPIWGQRSRRNVNQMALPSYDQAVSSTHQCDEKRRVLRQLTDFDRASISV